MKNRQAGVVSVVLVNFRGAEDTITAVRGLREQNWPADRLEIIVVENGSGDDSLEKLQEISDLAKIVDSGTNLGFAGGSNFGMRKSSGEFIAFLNNDARPDPDWIAEAVRTFDSGLDVGAVASKVLDWDGRNLDFGEASLTWYGMGYKPGAGAPYSGEYEVEKDVLFGTGAAMFVRADLFLELGGFDETYFMFYEDVDLGWRINLRGYRFRYQPRSVAFHKHHASMEKFGSFRETYLLERNALYTLYKNLDDASLAAVFPGALLLAVRRAIARGELDSSELDIRRPGNDEEMAQPVSKQTLAGIYALDQFVEHLPESKRSRDAVQSTRVRSDREIIPLLGKTDEPAYPISDYLEGYSKIVDALGQLGRGGRRRVLVITGDPLGAKMAGPAIRAWNMADQLSNENDVRLVSLGNVSRRSDRFEVEGATPEHPSTMKPHEAWADVIVLQGHALALFPALEVSSKVIVVDIYDPMHLEQLEQGRHLGVKKWNSRILATTDLLNHQLERGDFFLAASERQRHFWLGQLAGLGRINAHTYSADSDLKELIGVAPFGLEAEVPVHTRNAIRGVVPGISHEDKLVIWGGGIYNWFDPETLIKAIAVLAERRPNLRLFFMGVKHPNPHVPEMEVVSRSRELARSLGLLNSHVFFNENWVDYSDRHNYLLEADAGVSTHFQHIETTFSFRTRILDYLWVGLPIVTTEGDSFAELVARKTLGEVVSEQNVSELVLALERVLYDENIADAARANVLDAREAFTWERSMKALVDFCRAPRLAPDRLPSTRDQLISSTKNKKNRGKSRLVKGLRHDLGRVRHYFSVGGLSAVKEQVRSRARIAKADAARDE